MSSYNSFAPYYDLVMGDRTNEALLLRRLIRQHAPRAKTLLELGCGTGSLVRVLSRSYACLGVDRSPQMVAKARRKVPGARFAVGDITSFRQAEQFDVVICAFDTLNHVLSYRQWQAVFQVAQRHLNPGGVFIFDINTEHKLDRYVTERVFAERLENNLVSVIDAEKRGASQYTVRVSAFVHTRGKHYVLHELFVPEATFPVPRVRRTLANHFRRTVLFDPDRTRPSGLTEEMYFICKLPRQ